MSNPAPALIQAGPGRRYLAERVVRLGDVLPTGRVRLDAVARYLQDIASDDGADAGIDHHLAWVVRRILLRLDHRPSYGQRLDLVTWASGAGSRWAERRTTISVAGRIAVETAALWVCVDTGTLRPVRLSDRFWAMYGDAAGGRSVSSRLQHPGPPAGVGPGRSWSLRLADLDLFGHVNNAVAWAAVEDEAERVASGRRIVWAEVEYRSAIEPGAEVVLASRLEAPTPQPEVLRCWLLGDGAVLASAAVRLGAGEDDSPPR